MLSICSCFCILESSLQRHLPLLTLLGASALGVLSFILYIYNPTILSMRVWFKRVWFKRVWVKNRTYPVLHGMNMIFYIRYNTTCNTDSLRVSDYYQLKNIIHWYLMFSISISQQCQAWGIDPITRLNQYSTVWTRYCTPGAIWHAIPVWSWGKKLVFNIYIYIYIYTNVSLTHLSFLRGTHLLLTIQDQKKVLNKKKHLMRRDPLVRIAVCWRE